MTELRVVVADDHALTLSAISDSLKLHGVTVEARAANAPDAVSAVVKHQPDALVIDLDLGPGPSGIDVALSLRRRFPAIGVVILSGYSDPRLLSPTLPAAPRGTVYLVKQRVTDVSSVVEAVRDAVERAATDALSSIPSIDLTGAQTRVLLLVAQGLTNAAIAERLHITEGSVAKSINRVAKKLGLETGRHTNVRSALANRYFALIGNHRAP